MVLASWAASPARFREDANAEEALAGGGYAGRVLVELAANAADAAREIGVPARIRMRLRGDELRVANTGSALTAQGVAALTSLRASAKRDTLDSVGHFGVGFTAVLSWSQLPRIISTSGGVRFDGPAGREQIAALGVAALDREVLRRGGRIPVLRLPWPSDPNEDPLPDGYTTEVRLPLEAGPRAEVERVLADPGTAEDLFWALSDLAEIDLPDRAVRCGIDESGLTVIDDGRVRKRYRTADRNGNIPVTLLADRPVEERTRAQWRITWALPVEAESTVNSLDQAALALAGHAQPQRTVIGAPTPTDEPLTLPARLVGTFPVDDTRRRLATGPLRDYLLEQAADTYLDLMAATEPADRWSLLPAGGFPAGPIDSALRDAVLERVAVTPLFHTAVGDLVTLAEACQLPGLGDHGTALLGQAIPGLLPPQSSAAAGVLQGLGVETLNWSQASSALAGIERDPLFWWQVYDAVSRVDRPPNPEDLADIPIPLTGGRRVLGARGCLLPSADAEQGESGNGADRIDADLARRAAEVIPALRIVDPLAAHPLLERLGARAADPDTLLADPGVAAAIEQLRRDLDEAEPDPNEVRDLATVVLDLLAAGGHAGRAAGASELAQAGGAGAALLGELVLTDLDGQPWPASELLVPGAALAPLLASDADRPLVGEEWSDRYPTDVLVAAGVRSGFAVVTITDPADDQVNLPDLAEWLDLGTLGPGESCTVLADLDLVDPDRWEPALQVIAADRDARACLTPSGSGLSYSGWWLSRHARIGGRAPADWRLATAYDLEGLYDPLPPGVDPLLARWIGVRAGLADAAADDPEDLLDRLADPALRVSSGRVAGLTAAVVAALADAYDLDLPSGVRTVTGDVVDAAEACVLDEPWLAQVLPAARLVPGGHDPQLVARVLDLPLASAVTRVSMVDTDGSTGSPSSRWAQEAHDRLELAAAAVGLHLANADIAVRNTVRVVIDDADPVAVSWWGSDTRLWTDGSAQACGRAVAWAAGLWAARHRAVAAAGDDVIALAEDGLA